jgi:hypothetical protein
MLSLRVKNRISTASSTTDMRPSLAEYHTPVWLEHSIGDLDQFCTGDYIHLLAAPK